MVDRQWKDAKTFVQALVDGADAISCHSLHVFSELDTPELDYIAHASHASTRKQVIHRRKLKTSNRSIKKHLRHKKRHSVKAHALHVLPADAQAPLGIATFQEATGITAAGTNA